MLVRVCFHLLACCIHMAVSCLRKCMHTATKMTVKVRHCHECVLADVDYAGYALILFLVKPDAEVQVWV